MTRRRVFLLLTTCHFLLTFATLLTAASITMAAFEGEGSGYGSTAMMTSHRVLTFPIGALWMRLAPGTAWTGFPIDHLFLILNSMLWAAGAMLLWRLASNHQ